MEQKRIGRLQTDIGWILIIVSIIIGLVGFWIISSRMEIAFGWLAKISGTAAKNNVLSPEPVNADPYTILLDSIYFIGAILFYILVFALFCIGILFITEGTSKIHLDRSHPHLDKGHIHLDKIHHKKEG